MVTEVTTRYGAEFKLDVGLYRLDQQVACQRIGKPFTDVNLKDRAVALGQRLANAIAVPQLRFATASV